MTKTLHEQALAQLLLATIVYAQLGCGGHEPAQAGPLAEAQPELFRDATERRGLRFRHVHGGSGKKYLPETMGAGCGMLDYDRDGWLDLYLVQSGPLPGYSDPTPLPNRLFRNVEGGSFEDVTAKSGAGDTGYGMGCAFGDVDNDGWTDIFVANFGPDVLLRNRGDGTFEDISKKAGVDDGRWGSSAAFADYDRDGDLDLFVVNYLDATLENHRFCREHNLHVYCHPDAYDGVRDSLYRNDGGGIFTDVTESAGTFVGDSRESKGLGVVWTDFDGDGWEDIYVANDSTRNYLFRNEGNGRFSECAVARCCAYNEWGQTQASMGIGVGDFDANGFEDLLITNLEMEGNTFYANRNGVFEDRSRTSGFGPPSLPFVGFGALLLDLDNDGDLDGFVAYGHIIDNVAQYNPGATHAQRNQLFEQFAPGRVREISASAGSCFAAARVHRGTACGDVDNDGDLDLLVNSCNQEAILLENLAGSGNPWVRILLLSRYGGRDAIGARVVLRAGGVEQMRVVHAGTSYQSQSECVLHFGLGAAQAIESATIRWPEGDTQVLGPADVPTNRLTIIRQAGRP